MAVAGSAESVSLLLAGGRVERRRAAEAGEGPFVAEPVTVLAGRDEEGSGGVGADADLGDELWGRGGNQGNEHLIEGGHFGVELEHSPGQGTQCHSGPTSW